MDIGREVDKRDRERSVQMEEGERERGAKGGEGKRKRDEGRKDHGGINNRK